MVAIDPTPLFDPRRHFVLSPAAAGGRSKRRRTIRQCRTPLTFVCAAITVGLGAWGADRSIGMSDLVPFDPVEHEQCESTYVPLGDRFGARYRECSDANREGLISEMLQAGRPAVDRPEAPPSTQATAVLPMSSLLGDSVAALSDAVDIPDSGLRAAIASRLGKSRDDPITGEDMASLITLSAANRRIADLTGLRHATNLRQLYLDRNEILDVSELASLPTLTHLSLRQNIVVDVAPLASLRQLRSLALSDNAIDDAWPLRGLPNLLILDLASNDLQNAWPLSYLTTLRDLRLDDNWISDLWPLADLHNLRYLTLDDNLIEHVSPLSGLTALRTLYLGGNQIASISWLSSLLNLERMHLGGNRIVDISALAGLAKLSLLGLGSNQIQDISPLSGLSDLTLLDLGGNAVVDVSPLAGLTNLTGLGLAGNDIVDAGALSGLSRLTVLELDRNALTAAPALTDSRDIKVLSLGDNLITDVASLAELTSLHSLHLHGNAIMDIGPLSSLTEIKRLDLEGNEVEDIAPLANLERLEYIDIWDNNLSDLSPLSGLTNLTVLVLGANKIDDVEALAGLEALDTLSLTANQVSDVSALARLADLRLLSLGRNTVSDVSPLAELTKLQHLYLWENDVADVSPLSRLTNLTRLSLSDNDVAEIGPLSELSKLIQLDLGNNEIADIAALSGLTKLWRVWLMGNDIDDISPLVDNTGFGSGDYVDLRRNPLAADSTQRHITALRERGARVVVDVPDLVAESPSVSEDELAPDASFTLSATVRNRGAASATATTLRYYRSPNSTISASDAEVGTDDVDSLAASAHSDESISLTAPSSAGTYYYGACVDSVPGETNTRNNCSPGVGVTVSGDTSEAPDLIVESPSVDDDTPDAGASFTLSATVRNSGDGRSSSTTLRYYRSPNSTISSSDTQVGTDFVSGLAASARSEESISLTAPSSAGTYYYGACVDSVSGETNTRNNCSPGVGVTVSGDTSEAPDLVVESPSVDDDTPDAGGSLRLSATVRNVGDERSSSTTLRYYRSSDSTVSSSDTQVGTDFVSGLAASASSEESISLTAPSTPGTYYYGGCVDSVSGESNTGNNCSSGVRVTVSDDDGGGGDSYCRDGDTIGRGERCDVYSTDAYFEVNSAGQGCTRNVPRISDICLSSSGIRIQGGNVRIYADRSGSGYRIVDVEPEPSN